MAKKKKMTKAERKEARLRKGKQWLLTYTGSPKKMNKHYRERFHVDAVTAAKDLQELGVNYTQEQLDQIKRAEEQRLRQRRMEREAKERERLAELYEDCDDRFAFIAGYTDGGAPFGVCWLLKYSLYPTDFLLQNTVRALSSGFTAKPFLFTLFSPLTSLISVISSIQSIFTTPLGVRFGHIAQIDATAITVTQICSVGFML